jgi:hypothetical protein
MESMTEKAISRGHPKVIATDWKGYTAPSLFPFATICGGNNCEGRLPKAGWIEANVARVSSKPWIEIFTRLLLFTLHGVSQQVTDGRE